MLILSEQNKEDLLRNKKILDQTRYNYDSVKPVLRLFNKSKEITFLIHSATQDIDGKIDFLYGLFSEGKTYTEFELKHIDSIHRRRLKLKKDETFVPDFSMQAYFIASGVAKMLVEDHATLRATAEKFRL